MTSDIVTERKTYAHVATRVSRTVPSGNSVQRAGTSMGSSNVHNQDGGKCHQSMLDVTVQRRQ